MSIAVIAGLGNPGLKYRTTRHNIGFSIIEAFAEQLDKLLDLFDLDRLQADVWQQHQLVVVGLAGLGDIGDELLQVRGQPVGAEPLGASSPADRCPRVRVSTSPGRAVGLGYPGLSRSAVADRNGDGAT